VKIRSKNVLLANFNPDHPYVRTMKSHGGKRVADLVNFYDVYFTYSIDLHNYLKTRRPNVYFLPFAFESISKPCEIVTEAEEIVKVCFVGNPDQPRAELVQRLANSGVCIDVYGKKWDSLVGANSNIVVKGEALLGDLFSILGQYRVQLNIFREHNIGSHNMRSFEIMAAYGIQLTPFSKELEVLFENETEIIFYKSYDELFLKIEELLALDYRDARLIRERVKKKIELGSFSYLDRAELVNHIFNHHLIT
jgi:spore maturation protein CgeB